MPSCWERAKAGPWLWTIDDFDDEKGVPVMTAKILKHGRFSRTLAALSIGVICAQPLPALAQATQGLPDPEAAARVAVQMARSLTAIEDGLAAMERSRWDPQFLVDALGPDPEVLRNWVRTNIAFVPYSGALRGAEGVLADHYANTLDGALLMAALLGAAGYETRVSRTTLDDAVMDAILTAPAPVAEELILLEPPVEGSAALAETEEIYELEPGAAEALLAGPVISAERVRERIAKDIVGPANAIHDGLIAMAGGTQTPFDPQAEIRGALSDHYFAEYRDGTTWVAADWLTGDGSAAAPAQSSFAPGDIPADLLQMVTIRIVTEQVKDGAAEQATLMEVSLAPALGQGKQISLVHQPMAWPADWPTVTAKDVQLKLRAAFATQTEWWPLMSVDGDTYVSASVRADGSWNDSPQPSSNPFGDIGVRLAGGVVEAGDQLRIDDQAPEELATGMTEQVGEWTAEWIDVTITAPGVEPRTERRPVFDLVPASMREAGQAGSYVISDEDRATRSMRAMSEIEIGVLPALPAPEKILYDSGLAILDNKAVLDELSADPFGQIPSDSAEIMGKLKPIPGAIETFASMRMAANPVGYALFQDRPLIVARHNYYERNPRTGDFRTLSAMNIIDAGMGVSPFAGVDPVWARIMQGLADAEAESAALDGSELNYGAGPILTSGPLSDWAMVGPTDDVSGLPADLAAQVRVAQGQGHAALVPLGSLAHSGFWWDIDPATGETIAMGPDGWGQALVEYAFILLMKTLWAQIACMAKTATKGALDQAVKTGKIILPKSMTEAKNGAKDLFKSCVQEALLSSIVGLPTKVFVGLPGVLDQKFWGGPNWGSRAPSGVVSLPPRPPLVDRSKTDCPPGLPGSCAIGTPRPYGGGPGGHTTSFGQLPTGAPPAAPDPAAIPKGPDEMSEALRQTYEDAVAAIAAWQGGLAVFQSDSSAENSAKLEVLADLSAQADRLYQIQKLREGATVRTSILYPQPSADPRLETPEAAAAIAATPDISDIVPSVPPIPGGSEGGFGSVLTGIGGLAAGIANDG
jgi:hypothetical protein